MKRLLKIIAIIAIIYAGWNYYDPPINQEALEYFNSLPSVSEEDNVYIHMASLVAPNFTRDIYQWARGVIKLDYDTQKKIPQLKIIDGDGLKTIETSQIQYKDGAAEIANKQYATEKTFEIAKRNPLLLNFAYNAEEAYLYAKVNGYKEFSTSQWRLHFK